ncbi:MAG: c-type cytochrome [Planctomycetaceae bacterium]|nr:c-type cytochrome [Planctomycetaceae bacterium]
MRSLCYFATSLLVLTVSLICLADVAQPEKPLLPPEKATAELEIPEDLQIEQVLSEPEVRQPIYLQFDERGRLWVMNYEQYPYPAGLKMLSRDKYWRAVYDKVPEPPPHHDQGLDRITIHEDTDGDGQFDHHKVFLEGLNIASSFARGRGGLFVMNPPYLTFYADANNDDVPDGDPEILLEGFGIEDTHSVANSLRFGPDGWLYGAQGSTVSGNVKHYGVDEKPIRSMGQLIWRYHPVTKEYEIFAEGGGNAFGVEFDSKGRLFSGHNGANTRGFHYVQGGYYHKGFEKHGPLSNPFTFGYFPMMKSHDVERFTHDFIVYEGSALPEKYDGKIYGVEPLQGRIVYCDFLPDQSSFKTNDLGHVIKTKDPNFRPIDIITGPDGAIYVSDMYEPQIAHLMHFEGRVDNTNGRVYRLSSKGAKSDLNFDLGQKTSAELIETLKHPNKWYRQEALRVLGDRQDQAIIPQLKEQIPSSEGQFALEQLWALYQIGGLDETYGVQLLRHPDPYVRQWTVRLLCDDHEIGADTSIQLAAMAQTEKEVHVRSQLASSARRLPVAQMIPIVHELLAHTEDVDDIHLPLLIWWAIEDKAESGQETLFAWLENKSIWSQPMFQKQIAGRLMRRYAQSGSRQDLITCARLFRMAPDKATSDLLMTGFEEAFQGRSLSDLPQELIEALANAGGGSVALRFRQGNPEAVKEVLDAVQSPATELKQKEEYVRLLGESKVSGAPNVLSQLLLSTEEPSLQKEILTSLQSYAMPEIAATILLNYNKWTPEVQEVAQTALVSRQTWAVLFVRAVDKREIKAEEIPIHVVRKMTIYQNEQIGQLIAKHWGSVEGASSDEMKAAIEQYSKIIQDGEASDRKHGKELYMKSCGKCHILFGEGGRVGPELTHFKRDDWLNMLINIVNPSADIREGFETFTVITDEGRIVTGFMFDQDNQVIVLRGADGQKITIERDTIDEMLGSKKSIMPEGLLNEYSEQDIRDLFSYLRSSQPINY